MTRVHNSRNLAIDYDQENQQYVVTVSFGGESISGSAPASCPRCGSRGHVSLWELEGPGSRVNTIWLLCAGEPQCMLDGEPLRWSAVVEFEGDWEDV